MPSAENAGRPPLRVRVDAGLTFDAREVPPKVLEEVRRALSFPNPVYRERIRKGLPPGSEPETLCFVQDGGDTIRLPRGAILTLRRAARQEGLSVACEDVRVWPAPLEEEVRQVALRDYQAAFVEKFERYSQGTVVIPSGGGKTRCALGAVWRLRTPTLVLVHSLDLAEQWLAQVRETLGLEAGFIGDGETRPAPVTVALTQALTRRGDAELDALLARFGFLVLDEAHQVAASTFYRVVDRCPARYRLGLTATPEGEDGLTPLLELFIGARLVVITHEQLVAAGVLAAPALHGIETHFTYPYLAAEDYSPMLDALVADASRNHLISEAVVREARAGHVCLVLSGRIEHCTALAEAVQAQGIQAAALTSEVKRKQRKALLEEARAGRLPVLVATSLADEGLDLPGLSRVFLAFPTRAPGRMVQRLGRLMRRHPEQSAVLFDFVDQKVPILRRHHFERRRLYAKVLGVPQSKLEARRTSRGHA